MGDGPSLELPTVPPKIDAAPNTLPVGDVGIPASQGEPRPPLQGNQGTIDNARKILESIGLASDKPKTETTLPEQKAVEARDATGAGEDTQ